jgi:uncharacterized coiled-coil protein SlyX
MKKVFLQTGILLLLAAPAFAQSIAINTNGAVANTSAMLDITSTTRGLLIPRMTSVQRTAIAAPAKGLIVFDITTNGLWFHNGTAWNALSSGSATNYWTAAGSDIYNNTAGNVGIGTASPLTKLSVKTGTGFYGITHTDGTVTTGTYIGNGKGWLGTQSNHPLTFFTNNSNEQMTLITNGNLGIGTSTPTARLHIAGNIKMDGTNTMEFGAGIAGKEVSAGKIGYQTFTPDALDIVGAGTGANRKIKFWNEGGAYFSGSVAVGVSDPLYIYRMDIVDRIRIRSGSASSTAGIALNNSDNSAVTAFIGTKGLDLVGIYGVVSGWGLMMNTNTGGVAIGYQSPVAGYRLSLLGNQYINGLLSTTGDVEIGADAQVSGNLNVGGRIVIGQLNQSGQFDLPTLEVKSFVPYQAYTGWTYYDNSGWAFNTNALCIRAHGGVMADYFVAISDTRIKNIAGISNAAKDLETVNALEITDYTMKDKIMYGNKTFKKVIAQQVEKVYPQVISKRAGYIPNVYAVPSKIEKTANGYLLSFTGKHHLSKHAGKIQVMTGADTKQFDILSIPSDIQVEIKASNLDSGKLFVYGEEVDDFRAVDYEGLTTLNISATQELSRLIKKQHTIIEKQQQQLEQLLKRVDSIEKNNTIFAIENSTTKKQ